MFGSCSELRYIYAAQDKWKEPSRKMGMFSRCIAQSVIFGEHRHNFTENVTKEPTCTESGTGTYVCSACGENYAATVKALGHDFVNSICSRCNLIAWNYTVDDANNIVTLNYYTGNETDVYVSDNYVIGGKTYKTRLASNIANAGFDTPYMFNGVARSNCQNIKTITFSNAIDTSNVTNMSNMFWNCTSLTSLDVSSFDTGKVTDMSSMFQGCTSLTSLDLSSFDTDNVTDMSSMFQGCTSLTSLDVSSFDTGKVTQMIYMFRYCSKLTSLDVSGFNTGNVTDMDSMFEYCESLKSLDLSSFNTGKVAKMSSMFSYCSKLTSLDVSNFNTSNVTAMTGMFYNCISLESVDLSSFNTGNTRYMGGMFEGCTKLKTIYVASGKWSTNAAQNTMTYAGANGTTDMFKNCGTSSVIYR